MMFRKISAAIAALALVSCFQACKMQDNDPYSLKIQRHRFSVDSFMKGANESPFDLKGKRELTGLKYFKPDKKYDIHGFLDWFEVPKSYMMEISNAKPEEFYKVGNVLFTFNNKPCVLGVYQSAKYEKHPEQANDLFCPFTDETTGKETYKSGRFLDLKRVVGSKDIEIDFNLAYNPYCAYSHQYECPVPPADNHLTFRVEAGEKKYDPGMSWFK